MPPGRSGPEFIARLTELEHFAGSHGAFNPDQYVGSANEGPKTLRRVGEIEAQHRFEVTEEFSPIQPYRSLQASRLKLTGRGDWPLEDFLDNILFLPYVEPAILLHGERATWPGPDFSRENKSENLSLAKLWDSKGLLSLFHEPHQSGFACRVFNAHKNAEVDRQIGDRRWINGAERHPKGPSQFLPSGHHVTSISCPATHKLVGCASDRKDFYHQALVSRERASTNQLPFPFKPEEFAGSAALEELYAEVSRSYSREEGGDRYGMKPRALLAPSDITTVYAGFGSLFQGDHLGVEYALASHCQMLQEGGLLEADSTVLSHRPFPQGPVWQGVVIDDYFVVSRERAEEDCISAESVKKLAKAEKIYERHKVLGSDEKTVRGAEVFKIIGAEVQSDLLARSAGVITVGAPASKRIPMISLTLKAACLPVITRALASRLAGNWVSIFMYRRPLCSILSEIFSLGSRSGSDDGEVLVLRRAVAEELVLASVFGLVSLSDITAKYDQHIYATDASLNKGAFTAKKVDEETAKTIWLGSDRRGAYTQLDNPARQQLRSLGADVDENAVAEDFAAPTRALDFVFDAVEICGGSGVLSKALAAEGLTVCPPIDLSQSKHYDLRDLRLIEWIFHMLITGRFRSAICEPVCTTFSPAQHPASRSYNQPLGFDRGDPKTFLGNLIAFRCLAIVWFAARVGAIAMLEQPRLSKMAWLSCWQFLLRIGFEEAFLDSCAFGCIHKKPFRFLCHGLPASEMTTRCPGGHSHVRIEGKFTKASAIYHHGLTKFLAGHFARALKQKSFEEEGRAEKPRLESAVLNDILSQPGWEVLKEWKWARGAHINILESRSLVALMKHLCVSGGDCRFSTLLDSRVAKGAHAKGRSSAVALRPSLLRGCSYAIAGNLHPAYGFAPTRLNTADAPTRDRPLPKASTASILDHLSTQEVASLHSLQFSRAVAGWVRLTLLAAFCTCPVDGCSTRHPPPSSFHGIYSNFGFWIFLLLAVSAICLLTNPIWTSSWSGNKWIFKTPNKYLWALLALGVAFGALPCAHAMPLQPAGSGETQRAARRAGTVLQPDRVILASNKG